MSGAYSRSKGNRWERDVCSVNVLALDLSLNSTGYAYWNPDGSWNLGTIDPKGRTGERRLSFIRDRVLGWAEVTGGLVAIEGYAYARANQAHQIGELGGVVRLALHDAGVEFIEVAPSSVKKYATGKGNANKNAMLVAAGKRLGYGGDSNDEADAAWLCALVLDALGCPVVDVPQAHRAAVTAVRDALEVVSDAA